MDCKLTNSDAPTPPTPLELASLKFEDDLGLALDNIRGVAYLLGNHADDRGCDGERHALNMLAASLYENAEAVERARDAMVELRSTGHPSATTPEGDDGYAAAYGIADFAQSDALAAKGALERLTVLLIAGELQTDDSPSMDALEVYAAGIGARIGRVADALADLMHRIKQLENKSRS